MIPTQIEGYASLFHQTDLAGDTVLPGAFRSSLTRRAGTQLRMLFAHDPDRPVGLWTDVREDGLGLFVRGEPACSYRCEPDQRDNGAGHSGARCDLGLRLPNPRLEAQRCKSAARSIK